MPRPAVPGHRTPQLQVTSERQARAQPTQSAAKCLLGLWEHEAERVGKWDLATCTCLAKKLHLTGAVSSAPACKLLTSLLQLQASVATSQRTCQQPLCRHIRDGGSPQLVGPLATPWNSRSVQFHTFVQHIGQASCHAIKRNRMKRSVTLLLLGLLLWSAVAARAQDDATPEQQEEDAQQPDAAADQAQQGTDPSAGVSQPEGGGERSAEVKTEPAAEEAPATPDAADTQPEDKQPEDAQPASGTEDRSQPAAADAKPAEATPEAASAEPAAGASADQEATPQADEVSKQLAQRVAVTTPEQLQAQVDAAIQMQVSSRLVLAPMHTHMSLLAFGSHCTS